MGRTHHRLYWMLYTWENGNIGWAPQFGDRNRDVVLQEERDTYHKYPKIHRRIEVFDTMEPLTNGVLQERGKTLPSPYRHYRPTTNTGV